MDLTLLIPVAVFLMVSAGLWALADRLRGPQQRVHERLDALERTAHSSEPNESVLSRVSSAVSELVEKTSPQLAKPLEPTNTRDADRLRNAAVLCRLSFRSRQIRLPGRQGRLPGRRLFPGRRRNPAGGRFLQAGDAPRHDLRGLRLFRA